MKAGLWSQAKAAFLGGFCFRANAFPAPALVTTFRSQNLNLRQINLWPTLLIPRGLFLIGFGSLCVTLF